MQQELLGERVDRIIYLDTERIFLIKKFLEKISKYA